MEIFLPTLHTFENNNIFTGSCGLLRFRIAPTVVMATPKEVDLAASSIGMSLFKELGFSEEKVWTRYVKMKKDR